jgi:outer membrane immunogenic protein
MRLFHRAALAGVAIFGFASVSSAADLPVKAPPMVAPLVVAYNWSGFYIGVNAGGDWGTSDPSTTTVVAGWLAGCPGCVSDIANNGSQSFKTDGFTGGVQGGYNWQTGNIVLGVEGDFEYFRSSGSNSTVFFSPTCPCTMTINSSMSTDWLFTLRPRVGFAVNNWLFYATGGLAVSELKGAWSYGDNFGGRTTTESGSVSTVKAGWVIGGGLETALPGNWLIGAEYLYVKFADVSTTSNNLVNSTSGPYPASVFTHSADLAVNIARIRVSKKF